MHAFIVINSSETLYVHSLSVKKRREKKGGSISNKFPGWFGQTKNNVGICSQDSNACIMYVLSECNCLCPLHVCLRVDEVFCIYFIMCLSGHASHPFYLFIQSSLSHNSSHVAMFVNAHIWVHLSSTCSSQDMCLPMIYVCMHAFMKIQLTCFGLIWRGE